MIAWLSNTRNDDLIRFAIDTLFGNYFSVLLESYAHSLRFNLYERSLWLNCRSWQFPLPNGTIIPVLAPSSISAYAWTSIPQCVRLNQYPLIRSNSNLRSSFTKLVSITHSEEWYQGRLILNRVNILRCHSRTSIERYSLREVSRLRSSLSFVFFSDWNLAVNVSILQARPYMVRSDLCCYDQAVILRRDLGRMSDETAINQASFVIPLQEQSMLFGDSISCRVSLD